MSEQPLPPEPPSDFGRHNMAVIGREHLFLSHLPMFMAPHDAQLLLEAAIEVDGRPAMERWTAWRAQHPEPRFLTVFPEKFPLSTLYQPDPPARTAFLGTFFAGHLERGAPPIPELTDVTVRLTRVVHARRFGSADKPDELTYVLFGRGEERYLAHVIRSAPDFDQLLAVRVGGEAPTEEELERGVSVVLLERPNTAATRLRDGERAAARGHVTGAHRFLELELDEIRELYFEEGELMASRGAFEPTPLETEAGFGE